MNKNTVSNTYNIIEDKCKNCGNEYQYVKHGKIGNIVVYGLINCDKCYAQICEECEIKMYKQLYDDRVIKVCEKCYDEYYKYKPVV